MDWISPISNGYAVTANYLGLVVCILWFIPAMRVIKKKIYGYKLEHFDLLILGVFIGFLGFIDGTYWLVAWSFEYYNSDYFQWFFDHGTLINIATRQTTFTIAAYCHIKSAYLYFDKEEKANNQLSISVLIGSIYAFVMLFTSPG